MVSDINYWSKVLKRLFLLALTVVIILICFKLSGILYAISSILCFGFIIGATNSFSYEKMEMDKTI